METVLIVDDDRLIRQIAGDILLEDGYRVLTAANTKEGLAILVTEKVDVILLDIVMPTESGLDMIPRIKSINEDIVIIILTAHASTDSALAALSAHPSAPQTSSLSLQATHTATPPPLLSTYPPPTSPSAS